MPPSKSGIADYSAALVSEMAKSARVEIFDTAAKPFRPSEFDIALYQLGNNPFHDFVYENALAHPGVAVMHESNLHHLLAHIMIRRGNWDGYVTECAYNGGEPARLYAERVRRLETGPDYDGLPLTRRLLERSRGVVAHSRFVADETREQGFDDAIAVIPHGASVPAVNRNATRHELGIDELTPLIGAFGYIKPYKRIAESLRAFRRLVKVDPRVRMILVGEPHPEFAVDQLIRTLGLRDHVRVIGYAPIEKFVEYMGACDIVLNLRFPTVGETSGSLQRALGLGKAVLVSEVGSFAELPDDICVKVPVGVHEEDLIFEYLNTLTSRPDLAETMGARARAWVERECDWSVVAERYVDFLDRVAAGKPGAISLPHAARPEPHRDVAAEQPIQSQDAVETTAAATRPETPVIDIEEIETWIEPEGRRYAEAHKSRFVRTLELTPPGDEAKSILEMGAYMQITPSLKYKLGYGTVRGCYYGPEGRVDRKRIESEDGVVFECDIDHFDAERHIYPYSDASFDTVLCCELIEHLAEDPMHMMSEINRILKPAGHLVLTTPNVGSLRAVSAILLGYHPSFFPAYIRPRNDGEETEARHNREYVPMEIHHLLTDSGFDIVSVETGEFLDEPHPEFGWITHLLTRYKLGHDLRGDGIYAVGRKAGPIRQRWPDWLYA